MKRILAAALALSLLSTAHAGNAVVLANDEWPPFILEGAQQGTAEKLVCQALERVGRGCSVRVGNWETVLKQARSGEIDGIAAAWQTPERETYLLFSEPYLTNRIVPVVRSDFGAFIKSVSDLRGLRVALVPGYAYGDDIDAGRQGFDAVHAENARAALESVRRGKADAALVDELVARSELDDSGDNDLTSLNTVLAYRSLHFAVSRRNEQAEQIIADFQRAYKAMLADGTVNDILKVDWLATDFGQAGTVSVVMRSGVSLDDLSNPTDEGSMYALDESEYQWTRHRGTDPSRVKYQVEGKSYSSLQSALNNVFGEDMVCEHKNYSSEFDCSKLFQNR